MRTHTPFNPRRARRASLRRRARRAFLLADVLLALVLSALLLVGALSLLVSASAGLDAAKQNVAACNAARQVIENLRGRKAAAVANGTYADPTVFGAVPQLTQLNSATAAVTVATWRGSIKSAAVTINWRAGRYAKARSLKLTALLSPRGVAP